MEVIIHPFYFSWLDLFFKKNFRYVFTVVACYKFENIDHARAFSKQKAEQTDRDGKLLTKTKPYPCEDGSFLLLPGIEQKVAMFITILFENVSYILKFRDFKQIERGV